MTNDYSLETQAHVMSLSRERMRIRKRMDYAAKTGKPLKLSQTEEFASLPKYKRIERLAELALHPVEAEVSAAHCIAAIKEINLMEHVYDAAPVNNVVQIVEVEVRLASPGGS